MATKSRAGDPSTRQLSEVARHVVIPEGIVDTLWFEVEERCREFGDEFDAWQDGLGQIVLGLREDGSFAATIGGITLSIPRQVAKTFIVMRIVVALCTLFPNLTVIWTAHRLRTATHTFKKMKSMVLRPTVRGYLRSGTNQGTAIRDANGEQEIPFKNGSTILFGAREQGFGRGFDEVDIEVFDEAQILTEKALEDMVAATNQSRFDRGALLFYMGTPPRPTDAGEVFGDRRREALAHKDGVDDFGPPTIGDEAVFVECSADEDAKPDDRAQWAIANPSYPHRTPMRSMLRLRKNLLSDDSWRREALGIWDTEATSSSEIPRWIEISDPGSAVASNAVWALAVSPLELGPQWASFGLAGRRADGRYHVEALDHRAGTWWVIDRAKQIYADKKIPLRMRSTGPENGLIKQMREAGVEVEEVSSNDASQAFGAFIAATTFDDDGQPQLHHLNDPDLNKAVRHARRKSSSSGAATWDEVRSSLEITPLVAVTVALGGVAAVKPAGPALVYSF